MVESQKEIDVRQRRMVAKVAIQYSMQFSNIMLKTAQKNKDLKDMVHKALEEGFGIWMNI